MIYHLDKEKAKDNVQDIEQQDQIKLDSEGIVDRVNEVIKNIPQVMKGTK